MHNKAMKSRPILFSAPMVRALLDGSKTQTRRVVKGPIWNDPAVPNPAAPYQYGALATINPCPYGVTGDRLWVRETFALTGDNASPIVHPEHGGVTWRATDHPKAFKWKPSIFMPRWASRITLEVTEVCIERLQDISESDAWQEGVTPTYATMHGRMARDAYQTLWTKINGPDSWNENPYVWVIAFKRIES